MAVIGFAIYTQKNLHMVLGCLMFLIGLIGVGLSVCVYQSNFMMIAYIGMTIVIIATGILVVRAKE
jgi:CHASE2 domain-containing sensor protein